MTMPVEMADGSVWSITAEPDWIEIYDAAGECQFVGRPAKLSRHLAIVLFELSRLQSELDRLAAGAVVDAASG